MIVSPPFLLPPVANETEDQFIDRCITGGTAGDGGFPVSFELNWHGGIHLTAPVDASGAPAPVRAIADGVVAFHRAPVPQNADPNHPLNYRGAWTDNGCVVIRHETEIGANGTNAVGFVYFSIYANLRTIDAAVKDGQRIYRKSPVGTAGLIYGVPDRVHVEVICDDANILALTGRQTPFTPTDSDGRNTVVFGTLWYLLPAGTEFFESSPWDSPGSPVTFRAMEPIWIGLTFASGSLVKQSRHFNGTPMGGLVTELDYEYDMHALASQRFPACPAAGYELLRFGRILGPDALDPPNAPSWLEVDGDQGRGWVNLNAANVRKFSDADFPFWDNFWTLLDASASPDSRCRDAGIMKLLDLDQDHTLTAAEISRALNAPTYQERFSHRICKLATEWDETTIDARFGWLKTHPELRMTNDAFAKFKAHVAAQCFWQQATLPIGSTHWHIHPKSFIRHLRKCGWLSLDELTQLMPRKLPGPSTISFATARGRFAPSIIELNEVMRRYNLLSPNRQTHFLAQTYIENALWTTTREFGRGRPKADGTWAAPAMQFYTVFYGRGIMQLTWPFNYAAYGRYRNFVNVGPAVAYGDARLTRASTHHWSGARSAQQQWFPRYDPEFVADDRFSACDSGGFYWVSKDTGHAPGNPSQRWFSINRVADGDFTAVAVGRASVLVNGGGYGFVERQRFAAFIHRYRDDTTETTLTETFTATHGRKVHNVTVDYTPQRP